MTDKRDRPGRRVPWVGIVLIALIIGAIIAFGIFKRKGSRIPPPGPDEQEQVVMDREPGPLA